MSEPRRLSALDPVQGRDGEGKLSVSASGLLLAERRPAVLLQLNGAPDERALAEILAVDASAGPVSPNRWFRALGAEFLWNGPAQWLVVSDETDGGVLRGALDSLVSAHGTSVTDLGHARTVVRARGAAVRDFLAKGVPMDVDAMDPGASAATLFGPFNIQLQCRAEDAFDLFVFRSFGLAFWECLVDEAREFGVTAPAPGAGVPDV